VERITLFYPIPNFVRVSIDLNALCLYRFVYQRKTERLSVRENT